MIRRLFRAVVGGGETDEKVDTEETQMLTRSRSPLIQPRKSPCGTPKTDKSKRKSIQGKNSPSGKHTPTKEKRRSSVRNSSQKCVSSKQKPDTPRSAKMATPTGSGSASVSTKKSISKTKSARMSTSSVAYSPTPETSKRSGRKITRSVGEKSSSCNERPTTEKDTTDLSEDAFIDTDCVSGGNEVTSSLFFIDTTPKKSRVQSKQEKNVDTDIKTPVSDVPLPHNDDSEEPLLVPQKRRKSKRRSSKSSRLDASIAIDSENMDVEESDKVDVQLQADDDTSLFCIDKKPSSKVKDGDLQSKKAKPKSKKIKQARGKLDELNEGLKVPRLGSLGPFQHLLSGHVHSSTTQKAEQAQNVDGKALSCTLNFDNIYPEQQPRKLEKPEGLAELAKALNHRDKFLREKSDLTPEFHQQETVLPFKEFKRKAKRERKLEREKTAGDAWFHLPAPEMTEEKKNELMVLKMRDVLDPKRFYKKDDNKELPKYFQLGTVQSSQADFYHSRVPKKQRKATLVDELLADADFRSRNKKKFEEIQAKAMKRHRGATKHMKRIKKKKR